VPGPRLFPEFSPVIESTEFGRSLPRLVASATASRMVPAIQIWFAPTGTLISNVGIPVSWQIGPSQLAAWSMFCAMIVSACPARVAGASVRSAASMALRTSGGRSVEVRAMSATMLSKKEGSIASSIIDGMATRVERDPLGELHVPADAYYGVQTQRAVENFPISGLTAPPALVTATVLVKQACARANAALGKP